MKIHFGKFQWRKPSKPAAIVVVGVTLAVVAVAWLAATQTHAGTYVYPLKVSANKRYLVDQNNKPFPMTIDTAWTWLASLPSRAEADEYLDKRKAQGFNTIISNMSGWDSRFHTKGGIKAYNNDDLTQPNDAYFATVDQLVQDAADRNMVVIMLPITLGDNGTDDRAGRPSMAEWQAVGTYVGNRYKNFPNVVWCMGGDHDVHQTWDETTDYTQDEDTIANAIKAADPNHIMTYHPALDTFVLGNHSWFDFYSYQENRANTAPWQFDRTASYYQASPTHPVMSIEPGYETGDALTGTATTPYQVRRNAWWSFLAGAFGVTYGGNRATWNIGEDGVDWHGYVDLPGAKQTGYIPQILEKFTWEKLEPEAGSGGGESHVGVSKASDGSLYMAYLPDGGSVTPDGIGSGASADWYDPSNGQLHNTVSAGGSLSSPGTNAAGDNDWLLVVHTSAGIASGESGATPTPVPTATATPQPTNPPTQQPTPVPTATPITATPTPAPTTPPTSSPTVTGDLDGNGKVDITDLQLLLAGWATGSNADINNDSKIDVYDLSVLLSHWGK